MWMPTDDMVHATGEHPVGEVALPFVGQQHILVAPVRQGNDDVGIHRLCLFDILGDDRRVNEVDDIWAGHRNAVGAIGVVEQADADIVVLYDEWIEFVSLCLVAVGTEMAHAE